MDWNEVSTREWNYFYYSWVEVNLSEVDIVLS